MSPIERVDRGVNTAFNLFTFQTGRDGFADLERYDARFFDEATSGCEQAAIKRNRNNRQTEQAIKPRHSGFKLRRFAVGDA